MPAPLTLGIDVGTSSAKAVVADAEGNLFVSASRSYTYKSSAPGYAEQDPEDWWRAVRDLVNDLFAKHPEMRERLCAVGISGQGVAAVLVGHNRKPVRDAILWLDTRCAREASELCAQHGDLLTAISGKAPAAYNVEPKLLWLRRNEPEHWQTTWKAMTTTGYVTFRLTGQAVMNHSDAGILLAYNLKKRVWSDEALSRMGLPREIFCDLAPCSQVIGKVTREAANETGLPEGLPVVAGGEDTSSAGLAMGVVSEDAVQLSMGSASTVYVPLRSAATDSRLLAFPHVLERLTLVGGSMVAGGLAAEWFLQAFEAPPTIADSKLETLKALTALAAGVQPGANGLLFLPYLSGELQPVNDGYARGVFFGIGLQTAKPHLFRAVLEGTAFAIAHNLSLACELGASPAEIVAVGGPVRNDLWCQIISDVTGLPLRAMEDRGGAAFGDAILAGMGAGLFTDPSTMQKAHAHVRNTFLPDSESHCRYHHLFTIYRELYPRLHDLFPKLAPENLQAHIACNA